MFKKIILQNISLLPLFNRYKLTYVRSLPNKTNCIVSKVVDKTILFFTIRSNPYFRSELQSHLLSPPTPCLRLPLLAGVIGVKGLPKELPGGNMENQRVQFLTLDILRGPTRRPTDIDTSTLVFVCALRHKEIYNVRDYVPAACELHRWLILLNLIHKWDYTLVFDGPLPIEKRHEQHRRRRKQDSVVIDAAFLVMCVFIYR